MKPFVIPLFLGLAIAPMDAHVRAQPLPGDSIYQVDAHVTDAQGDGYAWAALRGRPKLVSMFYTNCHLMCPLILESAKSVQKQLSRTEQERTDMLMISLDPARDTPEALRETALRHRVEGHWQFLRPDPGDVRAIASVLDVRYRFRDDGSINHTSVLLFVDADGRIRARAEVTAAAADPGFVAQVKAVLAEDAAHPLLPSHPDHTPRSRP